jgi:L-threonylcarbamoyladenylate synthase
MKRIVVSAEHPEPEALAAAVEVLEAGGLVGFPTDTVYGIAADPRRQSAIELLFALKGRSQDSAVPLIAADVGQARAAGEFGPRETLLAQIFWPGPLSIVVPARAVVSRAALAGHDTVAIRVPAHPVARELARAFGFCITATSANRSGSSPAEAADVVADTLPALDALIDCGRAPGGPPSTIVAFDEHGPVLVRAGAVPWDRVIKSLR